MDEVNCNECGKHLCWMNYSASAGEYYCDACAAELEDEDGDQPDGA